MKIFTNKGYIHHVDELMSLKDREKYIVEAIDNIRNQIQEIEWRVQNLERKTASAIDAVPGEWQWISAYSFYRCSECYEIAERRTPYCPNCGAKMDGERKDDD